MVDTIEDLDLLVHTIMVVQILVMLVNIGEILVSLWHTIDSCLMLN